MIGLTDTARLAATKLKTRKVRLMVTLVISSLLFSLLIGASLTVRGVMGSVVEFSRSGFGDRYIAQGYPKEGGYIYDELSDPEFIAIVEKMQKEMQAKKTAEAKRLGIQYDPRSDEPWVHEGGGPNGKEKFANDLVPEVIALANERVKSKIATEEDFRNMVEKLGAIKLYKSVSAMHGNNAGITVIQDGKEVLDVQQSRMGPPKGVNSIAQMWNLMSADLMKPFILEGQSLELGDDGAIPVIAPFSAAEEILGLEPLKETASSDEELARLREVRQRIAGKTFQICYRNETSRIAVEAAKQEQATIAANKDDKNFVMPSLVHDVPGEPCGSVIVTRDMRAADEKRLAEKQEQFDQMFGKNPPVSEMLTLKVVGINSDQDYTMNTSAVGFLQTMLLSTLGYGWFTPIEAIEDNKLLSQVYGLSGANSTALNRSYLAEFSSAADLRAAIDGSQCQSNFVGDGAAIGWVPEDCFSEAKFVLGGFGSSSVALDEVKKGFSKFFTIAALIVAAIATVILMGTVGRIIADSRRETAVFRAIGAKRIDIAQVYFMYTFLVGLLIALVSSLLGLLLSSWLAARYGESFTVAAQLAYNTAGINQKFGMTAFHPRDILLVWLLIVAGALLAAALPLTTNMKRNPINDMRDDR